VKFIVLLVTAVFLATEACPSQTQLRDSCQSKISRRLQAQLSEKDLNEPINIIATVSDTAGLRVEFPMLRIVNSKIVLGHLTRDEILSLCRLKNVVRIEIPKKFYPKN